MPVPLNSLTPRDDQRFWKRAVIRRFDKCWPWGGMAKEEGYGRFLVKGRFVAAHRVAYALTWGDPGENRDVNHTCRFVDCVNPNHLEAVSPKENRRRRIEAHREKRK